MDVLGSGERCCALGLLGWVSLVKLVKLGHAQSLFKVLEGALCLCCLLIEQVIQNVLVALDQSLRVLLAMLQLLVPVSLNALEQRSKCQLLGVS